MSPAALGVIPDVVRKTVGDTTYYFGTISSDKIKSVTFVPVIELSTNTFLTEDPADGYQRPGSPQRMRAFRKFLKENPHHVVPPVLLSGRGGWTFGEEGGSVGSLSIHAPAAIIDGQHRVGGYVALHEENNEVRDVPFILLNGLSRDTELETFIVVNNSQKGVPKSLTAFLGDSDEAQIAWALNVDEDSPFKDRISRTKMQREQLFMLHSVAKEIKRLFSIGGLQDLDVQTKIEFAERFFTKVADVLPDEWSDIQKLSDTTTRGRSDFDYKLLELTGLIAWCYVGSQILARSYSEMTGMNWDNVERLIESVCKIDWAKDGQYAGRTGSVGGKFMGDDMSRLLPAENSEES